MFQAFPINTIVIISALAVGGGLAVQVVRAEPPKTEATKSEPAKSEPTKTDAGHTGHEGHNHGEPGAAAGVTPVTPGATTNVRPPDVPAPTVQNKPGEDPKVQFDTPTYDFGRIKAGEEIRKDFWFTNTGTGKLEILKVRPSCGCTTAGEHDKVIEPSKTGKIPIKLGTTNMVGPITKSVTVYTNCIDSGGILTLNIKGEVWQPIQLTPPSASFGRITTGDAKTGKVERKVTITNNTDKPAKLGKIESNNPAFKSTVVERETGKIFDVTVKAEGILSSGMVSATISIETGVADVPKIVVPISAYVTAEVEVAPNRLSLPTTRTAPLQRHLYINNNGGKPLKISDIQASNKAIKHTLTEVKPGASYRITLDIPADYKLASAGDSLTFKTDNESMPTVTVPITELNYGTGRDLSSNMTPPAPNVGTRTGPAIPTNGAAATPAQSGANAKSPPPANTAKKD